MDSLDILEVVDSLLEGILVGDIGTEEGNLGVDTWVEDSWEPDSLEEDNVVLDISAEDSSVQDSLGLDN